MLKIIDRNVAKWSFIGAGMGTYTVYSDKSLKKVCVSRYFSLWRMICHPVLCWFCVPLMWCQIVFYSKWQCHYVLGFDFRGIMYGVTRLMDISFTLNDCFFFGAIISATDPGTAAVSSHFLSSLVIFHNLLSSLIIFHHLLPSLIIFNHLS